MSFRSVKLCFLCFSFRIFIEYLIIPSFFSQPDTKFLDGVHCNLGRTLTAQGMVEEAMQQYGAIKEPDYFTQCGLALASLKGDIFPMCYWVLVRCFLFNHRSVFDY